MQWGPRLIPVVEELLVKANDLTAHGVKEVTSVNGGVENIASKQRVAEIVDHCSFRRRLKKTGDSC